MDWTVLSYAFVVGMASTVNPCGAAMLPAYLTWFTGADDPGSSSPPARVLRAVVAGLAATGGFLVVFAVAGGLVSGGLAAFMSVVPEIGAVVGAGLVVLGVLTAAGRRLSLRLPGTSRPLGGGRRGLRSMVGFGISYALASLGCTLPVFLAGVSGTFTRHGIAQGFGAFVAYGLGMGAVLTALAVAVAVAPRFRLRRLRAVGGRLERPAGVLLAVIGAYLVYYWVADLLGSQSSSSLITGIDGLTGRVASAIGSAGPLLGLVLGGLVVAALVAAVLVGRGRSRDGAAPSPSVAPASSDVPVVRGAEGPEGRRSREWPLRRLWPVAVALGVSVALVEGLLISGVIGAKPASPSTASAESLSPSTARLLGFDWLHGSSVSPPPQFTLTGQHGHPVSLSSLRGKAVVLSFNDNHCKQLCPLYAQDVRAALADLGPLAPRVAFVGVNVNPFYPQVAADVTFDHEHELSHLPEWHFLTGPLPKLRSVWHAYGAQPITGSDKSVSHASVLEFIGPSGNLRGLGSYGPTSADATRWGYALATVAQDLLGAHTQVAAHRIGPAPPSPSSTAPSFMLPALGSGTSTVSLQRLHGQVVALNFFASWCSACQAEAAGLEQAAQALPGNVRLVGIDINDTRSSARAFVRKNHLTYPIGFDAHGDVAAAYGVSGLPTTVFVSPSGKVVARHVGAISSAALSHEVSTLLGHR
ncbi:MAG: redoxin domain-containing protein [Actinomycetota bacterium]|nr:redoxin domain-containing protein [Actinomycetota bacterium]